MTINMRRILINDWAANRTPLVISISDANGGRRHLDFSRIDGDDGVGDPRGDGSEVASGDLLMITMLALYIKRVRCLFTLARYGKRNYLLAQCLSAS